MSQVEKKDKKVSRVAPEYNDIFRRMFEVLSDSIDRHQPEVPKTRVPKSNDPIVYETGSRKYPSGKINQIFDQFYTTSL